jgi:hypothetical protein
MLRNPNPKYKNLLSRFIRTWILRF